MKKNKNKWIEKVILIVCVVAAIAVYMAVPSVHQGMNRVFAMFATGDFTVLRDFVASYGAYAAALSFLLMILQSIIAPLPAFLITFANANLFGWWKGAILSWSSAMAGAAICFYIARILGRDVAEKLTSRSGLAQIDTFFEKYGKNTILICRLLPFVSFDIVSYAAGLTSMSFSSFFIATGIGQLPATIVYSYVGGMLTGGAKLFVTGLLIIFALSALIFMMRSIYMEHMKRKEDKNMTKEEVCQLFMAGIDCSQVVTGACAEKMGMTKEQARKMSACFGGGMMCGETCGAVTGALMVLGMVFGHSEENDGDQKGVMAGKVAEFKKRFLEKYPSDMCREILGHDISKPGEMDKVLEKGLMFDLCPQIVLDVLPILEELV